MPEEGREILIVDDNPENLRVLGAALRVALVSRRATPGRGCLSGRGPGPWEARCGAVPQIVMCEITDGRTLHPPTALGRLDPR